MANTPRDQKHELAPTDRRRSTRSESRPAHNHSLVVTLWLLALLIAEILFWILAFAHMNGT